MAERLERERLERERVERERRARIERERAERQGVERERRERRRRERAEKLRRDREALRPRRRTARPRPPQPEAAGGSDRSRRSGARPQARPGGREPDSGCGPPPRALLADRQGGALRSPSRWPPEARWARRSGCPSPVSIRGAGNTSLANSASIFGIDPGTPTGLVRGYVFPILGPHDFGDKIARFGAPRYGHIHEGQDIFAKTGTPEVAVHDGVVVDRGKTSDPDDGGRGNYVVIYSPPDNHSFVYMHMLKPSPVDARRQGARRARSSGSSAAPAAATGPTSTSRSGSARPRSAPTPSRSTRCPTSSSGRSPRRVRIAAMPEVTYERRGAAGVLTIDRPERRNAVDPSDRRPAARGLSRVRGRRRGPGPDPDRGRRAGLLRRRGPQVGRRGDERPGHRRAVAEAAPARPARLHPDHLAEADDRGDLRLRPGRRAGARALVRPADRHRDREARLPRAPLGRSPDRRRHPATAARGRAWAERST